MRRFALFAIFLVSVLALIITACNGGDETTQAKSPTPTKPITPITTVPPTLTPTTTALTPPETTVTTPKVPTPTDSPTIEPSLTPESSNNIIIDHHITNSLFSSGSLDLSIIPDYWIDQAKDKLHIAYGHTSHGTQLTTGMTGLMEWKGDLYAWDDNGGLGSALDLDDEAFSSERHDLGNKGDLTWERLTREYLDNRANSDVNVVIWSWCGGVSDNTEEGIDIYLNAMNQLETDFPHIKFVYMTGHADGSGKAGTLLARNQQIRDYCEANNKILYDFHDIESHDPNGNYFGDKRLLDNCDYDSDEDRIRDANWAIEYQNSHTEGVDWYKCESAHSEPLNANQKAYAAWWMFARIAGWDGVSDE